MLKIATLGAVALLVIVVIYFTAGSETQTGDPPIAIKHPPPMEVVWPLGQKFRSAPLIQRPVKRTQYNGDLQPPRNTTWAEIEKTFLPSAERGDIEAIEKVYASTLQCHNYFHLRRNIDAIINQMKGDNVPSWMLESYGRKLAEVQKALADTSAMCEDVSERDVEALLMKSVRLAAEQGDGSAQACYLSGALFGPYDSQAEAAKKAYEADAIRIADEGLRAGNWEILAILANAFSEGQGDDYRGWIGRYVSASPVAQYAILYLIKSGMSATGTSTGTSRQGPFVNLDGALEALKESSKLSSDEVRRAESWAEDAYVRRFSNHPFPSEFVPCPWQTTL